MQYLIPHIVTSSPLPNTTDTFDITSNLLRRIHNLCLNHDLTSPNQQCFRLLVVAVAAMSSEPYGVTNTKPTPNLRHFQ